MVLIRFQGMGAVRAQAAREIEMSEREKYLRLAQKARGCDPDDWKNLGIISIHPNELIEFAKLVVEDCELKKTKVIKPMLGQEAICPDGLGRITELKYWQGKLYEVRVKTYVDDRSCMWAAHNVELLPVK